MVSERDLDQSESMSRTAMIVVALVIALAAGWFFVSWAVFNSPVIDAVGESLGGVLLLLVLVSVLGALRKTR